MAEPNMKRVLIITGIIAAASLAAAWLIGLATGGFSIFQAPLGTGIAVDERQSLELSGIDMLEIRSIAEDVRISEGDGNSFEAWLHGTARVSSPDAASHLVAETRGATASIRAERRRRWMIGFDASELVLEVTIPKEYAGKLSVETVSGDLEVGDHRYAGVNVVTVSGNAVLSSIAAEEIALRTTSGDLEAEGAAARRLTLFTVSGDMNLDGLTGELRARTTSGDTRLAFISLTGGIDVSTTSGEVALVLPAESGFALDAHSTSGEIVCSFPILLTESRSGGGAHTIIGRVGDGARPVVIRTVSGDVRIGG